MTIIEQKNRKGTSSVKMVFSFSLLLIVVCVSTAVFVNTGEDVEGLKDGEFEFSLYGSPATATITKYTGKSNDLKIPQTLNDGNDDYFVTAVGAAAFDENSDLESITIPSKVKSIGNYAFSRCPNLQSVVFVENSELDKIGESAFYYCPNLQSINIPSSVTKIGNAAFRDCSSIESITIPSGVTIIDENTFRFCKNLQSITIPSSVTEIRGYAFYMCSDLQSITIPSSVKLIGKNTFERCENLQNVTLPNNVSVGNYAFRGCNTFNTLTISGIGMGNESMSILDTYFKNDPWVIANSGNITTLIIDTSDEIDIDLVNIIEGNTLEITSRSINVTGADQKVVSGNRILIGSERAGKDYFGTGEMWVHETHTLFLRVDPYNYGEVRGSGTYGCGTTVRISAIPYDGYKFISWSDGNEQPDRSIKLTSDRFLTAYFAEEDPTMCKVTVIIEGSGKVYGMGTFEKGTVITLNAVADNGYSFQSWSHTPYSGTTISLSVESNMVITATFSATDTGIGGSNITIDTTTAIVIILIIVIVFGMIILIFLIKRRRSADDQS